MNAKFRKNWLKKWGHQCVICGHQFLNDYKTLTKDHLVPQSRATSSFHFSMENIAPAHYRCNNRKGSESLIVASKRMKKTETKMGTNRFVGWVNKMDITKIKND